MTDQNKIYLAPTGLCDFDSEPRIGLLAGELASGLREPGDILPGIFSFVKELPYGLEDWDVKASQTLAKGWGMCSGKTNLLVAMLRSLGIPARYRIYRIVAEARLWEWITSDPVMAQRMGESPPQQDHVDCEVWLNSWTPCDPARDTAMERGLAALGIPLEREIVPGVPQLYLASLDEWAAERQNRRTFREDRDTVFAQANEYLWKIRAQGAA